MTELQIVLENPKTRIIGYDHNYQFLVVEENGEEKAFDIIDIVDSGYRIEKVFYCLDVEVDHEKKVIMIPYSKKDCKRALKNHDHTVLRYTHRWKQIRECLERNSEKIFVNTGLSLRDIENLSVLIKELELYDKEYEVGEGIELVSDDESKSEEDESGCFEVDEEFVKSPEFLSLPAEIRNLYFHLKANADEDNNIDPSIVLRLLRASEADLNVLIERGYIYPLETEHMYNDVNIVTFAKILK